MSRPPKPASPPRSRENPSDHLGAHSIRRQRSRGHPRPPLIHVLSGSESTLDTLRGNGYSHGMKVIKGKVVSGKVVVEGSLPEGATVTVLAPEGDDFTLTPDEESAMLAAISEADRGEVVEAETVFRELGGGEE